MIPSPRVSNRHVFVLLLLLLAAPLLRPPLATAQSSPGHTITWDSHSLILDGKRLFLYSGEFHYWRLPSRQLWLDRLTKMKAAGLNAVSIYFDWQYHSSAPGKYDFSGVRDVDYLLSLTDRLGLYVIARVGPYMNAEVDAGGLPGWILTKPVFLRSQSWNGSTAQAQYSPLYAQYSKEWYDQLLPILARHQVSSGGSVILLSIENEYSQAEGSLQYMQDLYKFARDDGITVPIFHNDFWFTGDWSKVVDLYAYDSYPYGFNCCHQWGEVHFQGVDTWEDTLRGKLGITTPMFVSELQGGSFDPWGGQGYDAVARTFDGNWLTALDQSALAQGTTILNTYMFVGGTSWGYMSEPGVYSSYDYGAPISESGTLRPAYYAAHRLAMFLQSYGSVLAGADAAPPPVASTSGVTVHERVDKQSGQYFIFLRHGDPGPDAHITLQVGVGGQTRTIPQKAGSFLTVPGHGAELLTGNVDVGPLHLNYSTSQVLTSADTALGPYLVLYGTAGSPGETDFTLPSAVSVEHNLGVAVTRRNGELRLNYRHTSQPRTVTLTTPSGTLRLIITSTGAASRYWSVGHELIAGPDLAYQEGSRVVLDMGKARGVRVYGAPADRTLQSDGLTAALPDSLMGTTLLGSLSGPRPLHLPQLSNWKFSPEAPEIAPSFDDSSWTQADHTSTANPNVPSTDTLLADDYGFHYGFVWYRGHFLATGSETGITLAARQSYSLFLNGVYLGGANETLADPPHTYAEPRLFSFPAGLLRPGRDNVIAVLTESMGHDEGWLAGPVAQSPQGILTAQLAGAPTPVSWRLQGDQGGENPADTERGLLNASGLYGERNGWYLPDFDDAQWQTVSLPDDWSTRGQSAPVGWYRTHVRLNLPNGSWPLGLYLAKVGDEAVIWVNGWMVGRYWQERGPQHTFYLPQGILKPHGDNVIAIAVWNRAVHGGLLGPPQLVQFPALVTHTLSAATATDPVALDYWHTDGDRIVDSQGRPVRIAAVNWSGMQNVDYVPAGLDRAPLDSIMARIHALGFNAVRLPFSNEMVEANPVVTAGLDANPDLRGRRALDIMDSIVAAAAAHGLRIILVNQRSTLGDDPQENGLWYTARYPESHWIADWKLLVRRYQGNATVVGVDLRGEPHTGGKGPFSVYTYLHNGATWGPYEGIENLKTDWRLAAERAGDAVLALNPHLLIFVEGIQQYPDPSQPGGLDSYWWAGILYPAARYPVVLSVPHQLVYSPHEYGPLKYQMPFFGPHMSYASQSAVWSRHWAFLQSPSFRFRAPIFIGEFGTCGQSPSCVEDTAPGSQGLWFSFLVRYLREHPQIGWAFWAVNGTNARGQAQPNYIFRSDWSGVRLHQLIDDFHDIEIPPPPAR